MRLRKVTRPRGMHGGEGADVAGQGEWWVWMRVSGNARTRGAGLVGDVLLVRVAFICCSFCRVGKRGARIAPANPANKEPLPVGKQWGSNWGVVPLVMLITRPNATIGANLASGTPQRPSSKRLRPSLGEDLREPRYYAWRQRPRMGGCQQAVPPPSFVQFKRVVQDRVHPSEPNGAATFW